MTVKIAQSFDGKIAGIHGERVLLSNALCAEFTHQNRKHSDVLLTTARTVNQDNPLLNVRLAGIETARPVAIIDSRGMLNTKAAVLAAAQHCHIFHDEHYPITSHLGNCTYHAVPAQNGHLDLAAVISSLGGLGYHDVWVEAGGGLFNALHQARLVDQTYIYLVGAVLGQHATSLYDDTDIFQQPYTISWQQMGDNMIASLAWDRDTQENSCSPV